MILKFPDLETLRLALTTGAVPAAVSATPATAGFDDQDQVWVETSASLPRAAQNELKKMGVQTARSSGATLTIEVTCWPELIPLVPDPAPVERLEQTPVLFDIADGEELARLAIEILRLGNDRQGYRWLEEKGNKNGDGRALLRVVGPPYYSLLRALDRQGQKTAPIAFTERAPRVWMELGQAHPLAAQIKPPEGKILLLRPPRQWTLLEDAPFRDIYEVTEFTLPDGATRWREGELKAHVRVAPSLKPGGAPEGAELWVLRDRPIEELNRFVQNADDQMLNRLAFAVGEKAGRTTIVLRVRQSKAPPPTLVLNAQGFKHYLKLPNLFLPAGTLLHPPIRRDQVRKLLAEDTSLVTWLTPGESGSFTPESLPEDAFRPLTDWIDYVLDHDREALQAWVQASQFDFEGFVCSEDQPRESAKPKKPPAPDRSRGGKKGPSGRDQDLDDLDVDFAVEQPAAPAAFDEGEDFGEVAKKEPSEVQKQLAALEAQFLAYEGGLDIPERQALWPELARLNAALPNKADQAGVCWMNALWEQEVAPPAWAWGWLRTEAGAMSRDENNARSWVSRVATAGNKEREVSGDDLDRLLANKEPSAADMRALAAYLVWSSRRNPPPAQLVQRLDRVQRFLEAHEKLLPVRAAWLAWSHVVQLSGRDTLALARARDRLLERLFHNGLRPEQDLPEFLRHAGEPTSQRFRGVGQWMAQMCERARKWVDKQKEWADKQKAGSGIDYPTARTKEYIDLIFSFALARLHEPEASLKLRKRAESVLAGESEAHQIILRLYSHRIQQALDGKPLGGPLPARELERLDQLRSTRKENETPVHYIVDKVRSISRILEPHQKLLAYRHEIKKSGKIEEVLAVLPDLMDRKEVVARVHGLLKDIPARATKADDKRQIHEDRLRVLRAALEVAPRVGEEFAQDMLKRAIAAYDAAPEKAEQDPGEGESALLEKALFVAAHFDRVDDIHALVARFNKMLQARGKTRSFQYLDTVVDQCFRGLRKMGMRDEIDQMLTRMAEVVLGGRDLKTLATAEGDAPVALRTLLHVAGGWYYFGRDRQADPVLQTARTLLFKNELKTPLEQTKLACAYAATVGQAPVELAQKRLEEVFDRLAGIYGSFSYGNYYSQLQVQVAEAVVLAVVSDDFTLGADARRWLDDDEYLVRRRIHRETRALTQT